MVEPVLRPRTVPADLVTTANGICGFLGVAVAGGLVFADHGSVGRLTHHKLVICLLLYGVGMVCDVLDGPVARSAGSSGMGPMLDGVCDAVTFGFLPAILLIARTSGSPQQPFVVVTACIYVGATILRLARFAVMEDRARAAARSGGTPAERGLFNGMPSPVGGNCILALVVLHPPVIVCAGGALVIAGLMVADFDYPNNSSWGGAFVAFLLAASFAALAGLISLDVPSIIALVGLLPAAMLGLGRRWIGVG